jgi:dipeptidyl aminopeptidase/acylaminoacyl peptidase
MQTVTGTGSAGPVQLPGHAVHFRASDGVRLTGWLARRAPAAPTVILVAGFKAGEASMAPYARFLYRAGYNVLLYDSRGIGSSGGSFSLGVHEVQDVRGAVRYLAHSAGLTGQQFGLLGVSLGAGVAIVAASHLPQVRATVADSAYVDQRRTVDRLDSLSVSGATIPLAPIAPWIVDRWIGTSLDRFSPLHAAPHIAPRALLLIHSRDDRNPTTPLSGAEAIYRAAHQPRSIWIAPSGGHAGALRAHPAAYKRRVLGFLLRYLPLHQAGQRKKRR